MHRYTINKVNLDTISLADAMKMAKFAYENRKLFEAVENERKGLKNPENCGQYKAITDDGVYIYICSRVKGHAGLHIACGEKDVITVWKLE